MSRFDDYDDPAYMDEYEDEQEYSAEELEAQAKRCLRAFNITLMLFGGALAGFGYYAGTMGYGMTWMLDGVTAAGIALFIVTFMGLMGALRANVRILTLYYTCLIFVAAALGILGGFCIILAKQVSQSIENNYDTIAADITKAGGEPPSLEEMQDQIKMFLPVVGGVCWLLVLLLISAMGNVVRLISRVKAFTTLLQATNIAVLPVGIGLIGAALYISDTTASVDAPYASFAVFILGMLVIVIGLIGCFGASIESRGIVKLFMIMISVQMLLMIAFGVTAFVQADVVEGYITDNWEVLRRVLPPNFAGKYDKEQFITFVESNLQALGFLSLCNGLLLLTQWVGGMKLRKALKQEAEEDPFGGPSLDAGATFADVEKPNGLKMFWKRRWTHGSKKSRCVVRLVCSGIAFLIIMVIVTAALVLYFSTSCSSLAGFSDSKDYDVPSGGPNTFLAVNAYRRGVSAVTVGGSDVSELDITFTKSAVREAYLPAGFPELVTTSESHLLTAEPAPAERVLGYDVSCQLADTAVVVPQNSGGLDYLWSGWPTVTLSATGDYAGVEANWATTEEEQRPWIRRLEFDTVSGPVDLVQSRIGARGVVGSTVSGEIVLDTVSAWCDPEVLGAGPDFSGVYLSTELGGVTIADSFINNCDVEVSGDAALLLFDGTTITSVSGGSVATVTATNGVVQVVDSDLETMVIRGETGSVKMDDVRVRDQIRAATETGRVEMLRMRVDLGGSLLVDTSEGAVDIHLAEFAGYITVTTSGRLSCGDLGSVGDRQGFPPDSSCSVKSLPNGLLQLDANINCQRRNDCSYRSELVVTSLLGTVTVTADAWDRGVTGA
jgi:hypothetical protein